jgi:RNA polymerase sigma-70 factor (ECF subfamily)
MVDKALQKLDPGQRSVVVLRLLQGYSTKETADILDLPLGTVLSRLSRAQKNLRKILTSLI